MQSSPYVGFDDNGHIIREIMRFIELTKQVIKVRGCVMTLQSPHLQDVW